MYVYLYVSVFVYLRSLCF